MTARGGIYGDYFGDGTPVSAPSYECRCANCERSFFADSKHRILCPSCKRITAADTNECPDCGRIDCQTNH
jgi:hypothetical protein